MSELDVEAEAERRYGHLCELMGYTLPWDQVGDHLREVYRAEARTALAAVGDHPEGSAANTQEHRQDAEDDDERGDHGDGADDRLAHDV